MKTYLLNGLDVLSDGSSNFLHGVGVDEHLNVSGPNNLRGDYLTDYLGSTSQLIDSSNALSKARLDYKSYGKLEGDGSNPVASNPYTYTGREDDGTGLYYYRNRYYDPELEVFVSQDPLGDAQRYVAGNPLSFTDPLGLYKLNLIDKTDFGQREINTVNNRIRQLGGGEILSVKAWDLNEQLQKTIASHQGELPTNLNIFSHGGYDHFGSFSVGNLNAFMPLRNTVPIKITLYACNTSLGEGNIARQLSLFLPNAILSAPNAEWRGGWMGIDFFTPTINAEIGKSAGPIIVPNGWFGLGFQTYQNGKKVP